jgi:predicted enzyme related to lactoylglutathione lyase
MSQAVAAPVKTSALNWFEIPTANLDRAVRFYETVLDTEMRRAVFGYPMAIFPYTEGGVSGALVQSPYATPSGMGALLYLNCDGDLPECVARVESAGGKVMAPLSEVSGGFGSFAVVRDTEGNHVALHSR